MRLQKNNKFILYGIGILLFLSISCEKVNKSPEDEPKEEVKVDKPKEEEEEKESPIDPKPKEIMQGVAIAVSSGTSFVIQPDNSLWGYGENRSGQLGDGTKTSRTEPIKIADNVKAVSASFFHTMVIKLDNSLWACGSNTYGQLGDGTKTDRTELVKIADNVKAVAVGKHHTMVVKLDNSLWACGSNEHGQLGHRPAREDRTELVRVTETIRVRNEPERIKDTENVKAVSAGDRHSVVLKKDNTLWVCGDNSLGQLGDGSRVNKYRLEKLADKVKAMSAGVEHTAFVQEDNSLWTCGLSGDLQVQRLPIKRADNVKAISAGKGHTLFIKEDNSLWVYGYGMSYLGLRPTELTQNITDNVKEMSAGSNRALIINQDGSVWRRDSQGTYPEWTATGFYPLMYKVLEE